MINFRFVKAQFKSIIIPLIIFLLILFIILIPALTQNYLAPTMTYVSRMGTGRIGAMPYLTYTFFGPVGIILLFSFSLILSHILVSKEIDRGYFASWLTTPMTRRTILNSKLFILISAILILYFSALIIQLLIFPFRFQDFNIDALGRIILYNFGLILLALFWASINWFFITGLNKATLSISVASGVSVFFIVLYTMVFLSVIPGFDYLKYAKYGTITSFFNSPFVFGKIPERGPGDPVVDGVVKAPLFALNALDFVWQLPVMFVFSLSLFPFGNYFVIKKDLHL